MMERAASNTGYGFIFIRFVVLSLFWIMNHWEEKKYALIEIVFLSIKNWQEKLKEDIIVCRLKVKICSSATLSYLKTVLNRILNWKRKSNKVNIGFLHVTVNQNNSVGRLSKNLFIIEQSPTILNNSIFPLNQIQYTHGQEKFHSVYNLHDHFAGLNKNHGQSV